MPQQQDISRKCLGEPTFYGMQKASTTFSMKNSYLAYLLNQSDARIGFLPQSNLNSLEQEIKSMRKLHNDREAELAQLRMLKRKLEDDYSYERSIRRKYQRELDGLKKECEFAHKMERYALDQVQREVVTRRKAEEVAKSERKMRQELTRFSDKRFGFDDIINLCEKKEAENISTA